LTRPPNSQTLVNLTTSNIPPKFSRIWTSQPQAVEEQYYDLLLRYSKAELAIRILMDTIKPSYSIRILESFEYWLNSIRDNQTRLRLSRRLEKASRGNLGDVKPVGAGVYEMREFFGPGWRMYYIQRGGDLIVMLGGGDKSTQQRDIELAKERAAQLED